MEEVVLVIHLILALSIIGLVLLQRSEGGGLGIGGSGGGLGNVATAKNMSNVLTKATTICAAAFFLTSLTLGVLAAQHSKANVSLAEQIVEVQSEQEDPVAVPPVDEAAEKPAGETTPSIPIQEE